MGKGGGSGSLSVMGCGNKFCLNYKMPTLSQPLGAQTINGLRTIMFGSHHMLAAQSGHL